MKLILDPRFFNIVIITLSMLSCFRWSIKGNFSNALYWFLTAAIVATVTFR